MRNWSRFDAALAFGEEAQHIGDVAQQRIALVAEITLHKNIARQDIALFDDTLTSTLSHYFLSWDEYLRHILLEKSRSNERTFDVLFYFVLLSANCAEHIPFEFAVSHNPIYELTIYELRLIRRGRKQNS